jgi:hypothetical protein
MATAGKQKIHSTNGKRLITSTGKRKVCLNCCSIACCAACSAGQTWTATFSGVTLVELLCKSWNTAGGKGVMRSGGAINGTYCLTCFAGCKWKGTLTSPIIVDYYATADCSGSIGLTETYDTIILSFVSNIISLQVRFSTDTIPAASPVFHYLPGAATVCSAMAGTFSNQVTDGSLGAFGGMVTLVPDAC